MIKNIFSNKELPKTFLIFYSVGFLLFAIPFSRPLFTALTPLSLLFVTLLVLWHHKRVDLNFIIFSLIVVISSFFIEVAGVKSGKLFGEYTYLKTLGPGILETPFVIGVNWLMLTLFFADLIHRSGIRGGWAPPLAAAGMVAYDLVLEQAAPLIDMWSWKDASVPLRNYLAWFLLALFFQILLKRLRIPVRHPLSLTLLLCQFFFFLLLVLLLNGLG